MKKIFVIAFITTLLSTTAFASDLDIQVIGGDDQVQETFDLDDIKIGSTYDIEGVVRIMPQSFDFVDYFGQYDQGEAGNNANTWGDDSSKKVHPIGSFNYLEKAHWNDSGENAEFAWLQMDLINLKKTETDFLESAEVKVIYDDDYEYSGWTRQMNYDYNKGVERGAVSTKGAEMLCLDPADNEPIGVMYKGIYAFGCTLPNAVVEDKDSPLRMEIVLCGSTLTYNIR